jgi:hypothetical protein
VTKSFSGALTSGEPKMIETDNTYQNSDIWKLPPEFKIKSLNFLWKKKILYIYIKLTLKLNFITNERFWNVVNFVF